jgi:3-methyladenine DNA glycosylase AlkD
MLQEITAERFAERLEACRSPAGIEQRQRYFKTGRGEYGEGDVFIGARMRDVFALAKAFIDMPPGEIELLLDSPIHEIRAGALSIMGKQAARKKTPDSRRKELYDLYLRRTDRINNWDLVDVSCAPVVGGYLLDKPRDVLYTLARSANLWERRIAIVATWQFMRIRGELADTFRIAEMLLGDRQDLIHKATGWMLREAGRHDRPQLLAFLDTFAATMPRTALRYAIEHLGPDQRAHYLSMKKAG